MTIRDVGPPETYAKTPYRIFRGDAARDRIATVASLRDSLGDPPIGLVSGYSFKTNPRPELVSAARACGFYAETISGEELAWAVEEGFPPSQIIYNGPRPLREPADTPVGLAFADSVEALVRNVRRGVARLHGVRLRPTMIGSRFGIPVEDDETLAALAGALEPRTPFAVSFHARRGDFDGADWRDVAGDVLGRAVALQESTRRPIVAFDIGGGWTPQEFDERFAPDVEWLIDRLRADLPACTSLIFEAGQAVCTPSEALLTTVLELRERRGRREVVIDAGYPDWPEMHEYRHGMYAWREQAWTALGRGPDRLLGRTCLEYDQIDGLRFPPNLAEGDRLLITDTGSYDHSMAFDFARGRTPRRDGVET